MTPANVTSRTLLDDIRARLQQAHFSARGIKFHERLEPRAVADQLHAIRLLAQKLDCLLHDRA